MMQVELRLHTPTSLKGKRRIVKGIKDRLRARFQVAVAETGALESYQEAVIGIAVVSNDALHARSRCQAVLKWLENHRDAEVLDSLMEVL